MNKNLLRISSLAFFIGLLTNLSYPIYPPNYIPKSKENIEGQILKIADFTPQYSILLSTKKGEIIAMLGPTKQFEKLNLKLNINDKIKLKGFKQYKKNTKTYFIATEIKKGKKSYKIKNKPYKKQNNFPRNSTCNCR